MHGLPLDDADPSRHCSAGHARKFHAFWHGIGRKSQPVSDRTTDRGFEQRQTVKPRADDRLGRTIEPVGDERRVDSPEIGVELEVAVVELVEAWMFADQARLGDRPDDEDRRGRTMIGALRGVFLDAAAKFAERQERHPVAVTRRRQVVVKRGDRIGQLVQEGRVSSELIGMGVEAVERGIEDPRAEVGLDDLRDQLEATGQPEVGVLGACLGLFRELLEPPARLIRGERGAADETQEGVIVPALGGGELLQGRSLGFASPCRCRRT